MIGTRIVQVVLLVGALSCVGYAIRLAFMDAAGALDRTLNPPPIVTLDPEETQ